MGWDMFSPVSAPGPRCLPVRALTTDELGLIKVVESRGNPTDVPKVVEKWGSPEASRHVLLASMINQKHNPIMAIARKNGLIELLNPLNGETVASDKVAEAFPDSSIEHGGSLAALHLLSKRRSESGLTNVLMCTESGKACLRSFDITDEYQCSNGANSMKTWEICSSGKVLCSSISGVETHALFAGKGVEVNLWDLDTWCKIWTAKCPPSNSLGIFTPSWFTASSFLHKEDHHKIVAGTNFNQVRLYDISAQRRPVLNVDFRDSSIRAIATDPDGHTIYLGTGKGDLASFDMRTGKLLGCFKGRCCGSIRSITRHPELPILATCGLDRYLRFWDTNTRQLLSAVFLKQILTNVVLDTYFADEETGHDSSEKWNARLAANYSEVEDNRASDQNELPVKQAEKAKKKKRETVVGTSDTARDDVDGCGKSSLDPQSPAQQERQRPKNKKRKKKIEEGNQDRNCCEA